MFKQTLLMVAAVIAVPLHGQTTNGDPEARVVIATSGGISLGSYQAGVNWGLVELLRRSQVDDTLRRMVQASGTAAPRIVGFGGASAGTISSLMSAIHYCTDAPRIPPQESLFWKIWVDVGWRQLMPNGSAVRSPEYGLIDRRYFETVLLDRLRSALRSRGRRGCDVEVAGSLTKQRAVSEEVFDHVNIAVQRHVGTYRLVADSASGAMRLLQASAVLRQDRSLGAQISLAPGLATELVGLEQVFDLVRASSSIPFVFAPVDLAYYRASELDSAGICPRSPDHAHGCAAPARARFMDGGAFDNRPISIADRLLAASQLREPPSVRTVYHTIFIVPSAMRLDELTAPDTATDRAGGTPAAMQFLSNMWRSAAEYELHAYARNRSADASRRVSVADTIEVTSRAFPIFGETLAHFGAFIARSFREHDFYVGVYDGIHFGADRLCARTAPPGVRSASEYLSQCHAEAFHSLMHRVDVGCTGHVVVQHLYRVEHGTRAGGAEDADCVPDEDERLRRHILMTIMETFGRTQRVTPNCPRGYNSFENALCGSGLLAFTRQAVAAGVADSARRWMASKAACQKRYTVVDSIAAACFVDEYFLRFLESPQDFVKRLAFHGLDRAAAVERVAQRTEGGDFAAGRLGLANTVLRSMLGTPTLRRFEWDVSSVPRECPNGNLYPRLGSCGVVQSFFKLFVPYYLAAGSGVTSLETGIRPSLHLSAENSLVFPLSWHYGRVADGDSVSSQARRRHASISAGVGVSWRNHSVAINECMTNVGWRYRSRLGPKDNPELNGRVMYRMQCDLLASRFTLGLSTTRLAGSESRAWWLTFGLADVNGLLYWLLPQEVRSK